jgi:hypothetical protein
MPLPRKPKVKKTPEVKLTKAQLKQKIERMTADLKKPLLITLPAKRIMNISLSLKMLMDGMGDKAIKLMLGKSLMEIATKWMLDKSPKKNPTKKQKTKIDKLSQEIDQLTRDFPGDKKKGNHVWVNNKNRMSY